MIAHHNELRRWYERLDFKLIEVKRFEHLPFEVEFMSRRLT